MAGGNCGILFTFFLGVNTKSRLREEIMGNFLKVYVGGYRQAKWQEAAMDSFRKFSFVLQGKLGGGRKFWEIF